jgi:hypothetical protein
MAQRKRPAAKEESYQEFLGRKQVRFQGQGFEVDESAINPAAFGFQNAIIRAGTRLGKFALFEECGLGKTLQELEWARLVVEEMGGKVLLLTHLGVARQTVREAAKFGYHGVQHCRSQAEVKKSRASIIVSNYDMLAHFDPRYFTGVILDESSILKNYTGKTKQALMQAFAHTPYRLCATATPAPNDHLELGNHAQFLGVMNSNEMISRWFINDSMKAGGYRLKRHAEKDFWAWVASWSVCIGKPSDLGYPDDGFNLPELRIHEHTVEVDHARAHAQGRLMLGGKLSATQMWAEKRATIQERCERAAGLVEDEPDVPWIVWVETNDEADLLKKMLPDAIEVRGSESFKAKEEKLEAFSSGQERVIITKLDIAGFGLNWQHCRNQVFASATFSYEKLYQGLRRSWRYGVEGEVNAHMIYAESEGNILGAIQKKQEAHREMQARMNEAMKEHDLGLRVGHRTTRAVPIRKTSGLGWDLYLGDCVKVVSQLEKESIAHSVYSPPFSNLYIYSDADEDMGNSVDDAEFFRHYGYLTKAMNPALKSGARVAVHCKDLPLYLGRDGAMGLNDFPGGLIKAHEAAGMYLEKWVTIWKDPVIEMQRTKNAGLLWTSAFCQRAERARQGMADYVLVFKKASRRPIHPHAFIKPIAESVVRRLVDLWANPGEEVVSPYHSKPDELTGQAGLIVWDGDVPGDLYGTHFFATKLKGCLMDGRNLVIRMDGPHQMGALIEDMSGFRLVFHSRIALTDGSWLVVFRKWVEEMPTETHVTHDLIAGEHEFIGTDGPAYWDSDRDYSIQVWQRYASPVWYDLEGLPRAHEDIWMDVQQTRCLNGRIARESDDEKHICPLQLDVIEKCIERWSDSGDTVFSPFAGVGSEGYVALKMRRQFVGAELKEAYWNIAKAYLAEAAFEAAQPTLFDLLES